eukprot:TRINITY_DN2059_c0_g1_i1.p1 TRINITY_DN2059_c0_g1~~TRINITY_DN2059_c0_g1_i1.p1  ORF type:complete len:486 (-),score=140.51 TRINITY_DN2059_c0_g1_i1:84-1487(-)
MGEAGAAETNGAAKGKRKKKAEAAAAPESGAAAGNGADTGKKASKTDKSEKAAKVSKTAKAEKTAKPEKAEKAEKAAKAEKAEKAAKAEKPEKPAKADKMDKAEKAEKPEKAEKTAKVDKAAKKDAGSKKQKEQVRRGSTLYEIVDELSSLNYELLKMTRDKRKVVEDAEEGEQAGDVLGVGIDLIELLRYGPTATSKLPEEVKSLGTDAAFKVRAEWSAAAKQQEQRLHDFIALLRKPSGTEDLLKKLTDIRHGLRDFQMEVLDDVGEALHEFEEAEAAKRAKERRKSANGAGENGSSRKRDGAGAGKDRGRSGRGRARAREEEEEEYEYEEYYDYYYAEESRSPTPQPRRGSRRRRSSRDSIRLGVKGLYEVRSSEGDWYPATILKRKQSGRYDAALFGAGISMLYPSVEPWEIRKAKRTLQYGTFLYRIYDVDVVTGVWNHGATNFPGTVPLALPRTGWAGLSS